MKLGPIIMILRTKDNLWNITTKNHQHQRNSKLKHRLEVMLTICWNSDGIVLTCWLDKGATVNSKCYNETLKKSQKHITRKGAEIYYIFLQQDNARPQTSAATTATIASLGFTGYHIQPTSWISLLVISSCSPNWSKISGDKTSVLMKKSQLQYASGFGRKEKTLKDGIQKLVECWQKCIEVGGFYVENWLCTVVNKG